MKNAVLYVYGIVRAGFDASRAPAGVDGAAVELHAVGKSVALLSRLGGADYDADEIEHKSGDVEWLSPRAMAHDRVLTWAQEHGGVIPLPMFSLWGGEEALEKSLAARAAEFAQVFARVDGADEFGVRIHRRDEILTKSLDDLDLETRDLRAAAAAASPGQRYLLERKLDEHTKQAVRVAGQRMAKEVFDDLAALSRESLARPLVPGGSVSDATLVLNGAFLVDRKRLDEFRAALGERVRTFQPRGLTFDFTGPWPPYNFSGDGKAPPR